MIGLMDLLEWKYKEGYRYVAVNEYTSDVEFVREEELEKWLLDGYYQYMLEETNPRLRSFQEYREKNMPNRIEDMISMDRFCASAFAG